MLKIGQNWVKLQIIPPNAQQRSAPLPTADSKRLLRIKFIGIINKHAKGYARGAQRSVTKDSKQELHVSES